MISQVVCRKFILYQYINNIFTRQLRYIYIYLYVFLLYIDSSHFIIFIINNSNFCTYKFYLQCYNILPIILDKKRSLSQCAIYQSQCLFLFRISLSKEYRAVKLSHHNICQYVKCESRYNFSCNTCNAIL